MTPGNLHGASRNAVEENGVICVSIPACRKLLLFRTGVLSSLLASSFTSRADTLRQRGNRTPFFVYARLGNAPEHQREIAEHGGQGSTNNPRELFTMIR